MVNKKTHGRGPLINSHSQKHLTPLLNLQPWIYMSAREYIFFYHAPCVYRYNKETFVRRKNILACARILILKISINLHWDSHSPRTWTFLTWPTKNMNREINWQRLHVIDWLTCNQKKYCFILFQCQNSMLFYGYLPFTRWLALFCYINLGKKGVPNPFHGCLWSMEYS